jgi:hypothetical protein
MRLQEIYLPQYRISRREEGLESCLSLEQYQQQQLLRLWNLTLRKNIDVISRFPRQPSSRLQFHLSSRAKLLQIYLQYDTRLQHCLLVLLSQSKEKKGKVMARLTVSSGSMSTMRVCTISYLHRWPSIARSAKFLQTTQKQFRILFFSSLILYIIH